MNADFVEFLYKRFFQHLGASNEQAACIARGISLGDRQGKLYQGMGVMEALLIPVEGGIADLSAEPELVSEGPTWAVYDGHRSTGYFTVTKMTLATTTSMGAPSSDTHRSPLNTTWSPWRRTTPCHCTHHMEARISEWGCHLSTPSARRVRSCRWL
jgi:hypothetical protein